MAVTADVGGVGAVASVEISRTRDTLASMSIGAPSALPSFQRARACCAVARPTRRSRPVSSPCVSSAGQRPSKRADAVIAPASALSLPAGRTNRHSGANADNAGASSVTSQWSLRPIPASAAGAEPPARAVAKRPCAFTLLPATCRLSNASAWLLSTLRRLAWPSTAVPASTLRAIDTWALPRTAVSGAARSSGNSRSKSPLALRRCGPRRHGESSRPGHQGSGSKSTSAA